MTEPTTSDNHESNNDDRIDRMLSGLSRPVADAATREAHLAAALAEFDAMAPTPEVEAPSNVISLASRRRTRVLALTSIAAASVFAVGFGVGQYGNGRSNGADQATVKNAALPARTTTCADVGLAVNAAPLARFGTYAVHRVAVNGRATLVIVDASCVVVAQFVLGG